MPPVLTQITNSIGEILALPISLIEEANLFVYAHLGPLGQLAFDLILFYLVIVIAYKVTRAVFSVAIYVLVPSVALSLVSSFVLPFGFASTLPVCVVLFIVINVIRS